VYCEIGTTDKDNLVSPDYELKIPPSPNFRKELLSILKFVPHLNSISFTGYYGEPTLNSKLVEFLKITSDVRKELQWTGDDPIITLFTNSSTLHLEKIRERVKQFDLVLAKLDVATEQDYKRLNCPHANAPDIRTIIKSLIKLKELMPNSHKLGIQCLICKSYKEDFISNDNQENIESLAYAIKRIKPDLVQVYSIARIPSKYFIYAIDVEKKKQIVDIFNEIVNDNTIEIHYY
jgi:wyosine [tRNA(Phe)-imidazoG37] synthetase (radical SAM superfamily)